MTSEDAIKWLENLKQDIGQLRYKDLWHYEEAIYEIIELLKKDLEKKYASLLEEKISELIKKNTELNFEMNQSIERAKPLYKNSTYVNSIKRCPNCGYPMFKDLSLIYTSNPPQYDYVCKQCGHTIVDF